jgi:hypothetical protein
LNKVAILQSNYIPWKGYFDLINAVDEFVLYDSAQYTHGDWRNRNRIKTPNGLQWLTIPVNAPFERSLPICEVQVLNERFRWQEKHWKSLVTNYSKAPYFNFYREIFEQLYIAKEYHFLSEVNETFIRAIAGILGIKTKISLWREFEYAGDRSERLLQICKQAGATTYLSGPAAKSYLNEDIFSEANIKVEWMNYAGYPEYPQFYPPFSHEVSILDLLFHTGPKAPEFMLTFSAQNNTIS